ncbi:hypothetical protein ACFYO1_31870 [Nocardia sp. NPDC006044]|uniref:hypothetical protein n=1 Tax=Nocardia sp. NPDC006044 TaxID=3364306 RepID=UPI0036D134C6
MPKIRFTNPHSDKPCLIFVEPRAEEYRLRPGDAFTVEFDESDRAERMIGDADFDVSWNDKGIVVWTASGNDFVVLDQSGNELEHGHQQPSED